MDIMTIIKLIVIFIFASIGVNYVKNKFKK
ncbi:Uncharacterised protein [Moraxella lacunata]|uniref:Uncharacterized protein n=1 Tax=Moraxella lacunata TaxID=477 RepID=A0A378TS07_MORLA|nr:Uncharacterised protein [Moraxella lacunata]